MDNLNIFNPEITHHRRLVPVPLTDVTVHDAFWSPKLRVLRTVTVNDVFDKFERVGAFDNFDREAQGLRGGHRGAPFFDGLILETMRSSPCYPQSSVKQDCIRPGTP
ncbi:MAG: hypothetical protein ACYCZF_06950 [Anaerolineae bacterium]